MLLFILTVLAAVALDQLSKYWVLTAAAALGTPTDVPILGGVELSRPINGVLHFTYVSNEGAAFGMLSEHRWVFMVLSSVAILAMVGYMLFARPKNPLEILSLAFVAGGGIGNMIDRIFRGFVVDFIDVTCINFYVFNVADCFVCVGCGLLILYLLFLDPKKKEETK